MTKEQARIYFLNIPEEDYDDTWEQFFFEQKQYILTHAPIQRVWLSKLDKLIKKHRAYLVLTDQEVEIEAPIYQKTDKVEFPSPFIEAFNLFHSLRNQHKSDLLQAQNTRELEEAILNWLAMEKEYFNYWNHPASEEDEISVIRSIEPDPMLILGELKKVENKLNIKTVNELKENYNILSENVRKEVKRLTLLAKDLM